MGEFESGEMEPAIDCVCDKIISHLEELEAQTLKNQQERTAVDSTIPSFGGDVAQHFEAEGRLIEETINGVRQKDTKYLARFINRPLQGLDLTSDDIKILNKYISSDNRAA